MELLADLQQKVEAELPPHAAAGFLQAALQSMYNHGLAPASALHAVQLQQSQKPTQENVQLQQRLNQLELCFSGAVGAGVCEPPGELLTPEMSAGSLEEPRESDASGDGTLPCRCMPAAGDLGAGGGVAGIGRELSASWISDEQQVQVKMWELQGLLEDPSFIKGDGRLDKLLTKSAGDEREGIAVAGKQRDHVCMGLADKESIAEFARSHPVVAAALYALAVPPAVVGAGVFSCCSLTLGIVHQLLGGRSA